MPPPGIVAPEAQCPWQENQKEQDSTKKDAPKIINMLEDHVCKKSLFFLTIISSWSYKMVRPSHWQQQNGGTQRELHHVAFD